MTKIIIERRSVLLFGSIIAVVVIIIASIIIFILLGEISIVAVLTLISLLILLSMALPHTRSKKEIIIIDDEGLTLNGEITFGPIPWDCISDVSISRMLFDKIMTIQITNMSKLESIFGETATRQIINVNRRTGEKRISFDLDLCKLRGIDLETIIKDRVRNYTK